MTIRKNNITLPDLATIKAERRDRTIAADKRNREAAAAAVAILDQTRKQESIAETKRRKDIDRRLKMDVANLKVEPVEGRSPQGAVIRVNRNTGNGHLLTLHRQHPTTWTKPMVDAGSRFSRDYDRSEFRGLSGMGLEPRVDSSGGGERAATGIVASQTLRDLHARIGEEYFAILVLVCGVGFTFTELHAQGVGDKRSLSDRLRTALNKAAAFYAGRKDEPRSDFMAKAHRLITDLKNRV